MNSNMQYCTFYIVRHGETEYNVKKLIQGQSDIPLNTVGEQQAANLAKEFKNFHFDAIFASDLSRAKRTAEIIALEHKLAVNTTKLLRERQLGKFVGQSLELLKKIDQELKSLNEQEKISYKTQHDIEDTEEMVSRFLTFLRETAIVYPGKIVLVTSHGGMIRVLLDHLGFFTKEDLLGNISNGAYIKLQSDGVDFFLQETKGIKKVLNTQDSKK